MSKIVNNNALMSTTQTRVPPEKKFQSVTVVGTQFTKATARIP